MDIGAFVQENRRWLVGILVAVVAFFIAKSVIGSLYDPREAMRGMTQMRRNAPNPAYTGAQVDELFTASQALTAERDRLEKANAFTRSAEFELQPGSDAGEVLLAAGFQVKQDIINGADERDVLVVEKDVAWQVSSQADEIAKVLFGIELMGEIAERLYAAHDAVLAENEEAMGLRSILQLRTEAHVARNRSYRAKNSSEVNVDDLVVEQLVHFKFEADSATLTRFFESCREPGKTLGVQTFRLAQPELITEPVLVTGSIAGIAFKSEED